MRDFSFTFGKRTFWLRAWWWSRWNRNPLKRLWSALQQFWGSKYDDYRRVEVWTRTLTENNARCYCPVGSITEFHLEWAGLGLWFEVQRDTPAYGCPCDKIMWLLFPENHECDIEDYGLERLQAEFPGVEAVR